MEKILCCLKKVWNNLGFSQKQHLFGGQSCIPRHLFGDAQIFAYTFFFSFTYFPIVMGSEERFFTQDGSHIRDVLDGQWTASWTKNDFGERSKTHICIQNCLIWKTKVTTMCWKPKRNPRWDQKYGPFTFLDREACGRRIARLITKLLTQKNYFC